MIIIKKLAPEFQIQLVPEFSDPVLDMLGLHLQIFFIVKPCFCRTHNPHLFYITPV